MKSALYTVIVAADPHVGVLIHLAAVGVEDIIVIAYFGEALGSDTVGEIEGISAAIGKAVLYEIAVSTESVPTGSVKKLCSRIDILVNCKRSVGLCIVVLAVNLIETLGSFP